MADDNESFYEGFKTKLESVETFPSDYTYKFIIPTDSKRLAQLHAVFDNARPQIDTKPSKKNKYTSVTIIIFVLDATMVIDYYRECAKIEGIIML